MVQKIKVKKKFGPKKLKIKLFTKAKLSLLNICINTKMSKND